MKFGKRLLREALNAPEEWRGFFVDYKVLSPHGCSTTMTGVLFGMRGSRSARGICLTLKDL